MTFCMTSATQSNSGASAYIGFLYALLGKHEGLTAGDLQNPDLQQEIRSLLAGVERSSGSSDWLKDLFLTGDYDAMVNYECLIIDANEQLVSEGKEPLYAVYPYDGLSIADSPLGYVDHGDEDKENAFLKFQEELMSSDSQTAIEATGRRITANGVSDENILRVSSGVIEILPRIRFASSMVSSGFFSCCALFCSALTAATAEATVLASSIWSIPLLPSLAG